MSAYQHRFLLNGLGQMGYFMIKHHLNSPTTFGGSMAPLAKAKMFFIVVVKYVHYASWDVGFHRLLACAY